MKIINRYIGYYIFIIFLLEIYSKFAIGFYHEYSLFDNSIDEFTTLLLIYTIFFIFLKTKNLISLPPFFLIIYLLIDLVSSTYNRYIDYSDLSNIPLLFDALLQSKGQIIYLIFIVPILLLIFFFKSKVIRAYIFSLFTITLLLTTILTSKSLLGEPFISTYKQLAFSYKKLWTPNKIAFDYVKTGRLSSFFYLGMIKKRRHQEAMRYLGDRDKKLSKIVKDIETHIEKRDIYLIGLESFFVPKELTKLKLNYINGDKNISYDVINSSSTMITSIFGGGTIQSEFEALCGEPALQKFSAFEFTEFTGSPTNCLPQILKKLHWSTIVSNSYKPQPSFEALKSVGFQDINFPKEYFPSLPSYITNKNKIDSEYAIFDSDLYRQNMNYIKSKYIDKNRVVFNYMFSVWGHVFHNIGAKEHPQVISIENANKLSMSDSSIRAINQAYYRIRALQEYFDKIKKTDPNALVIAFSDHRPFLDWASSYKKYGLKTDIFHNFIVIMDRGKYIQFKKPFPLYALPDIILDRLTNNWYCKNHQCKIDTEVKDKERYLYKYYEIMANAMKKHSLTIDNLFITLNKKYFFDSDEILFKHFSHKEIGFRWSSNKKAEINFNIKDINSSINILKLDINIGTFGKQKISIYLNEHLLIDKTFNSSDIHLNLKFNKKWLNLNGLNRLVFELPNAHKPNNGDNRTLAIQFKDLTLTYYPK